MGRLEIQEQYEDYIAKVNPVAMAIGRRMPYHLEYLRRHGGRRASQAGRGSQAREGGKEGRMET